jgi:hypothetical protein
VTSALALIAIGGVLLWTVARARRTGELHVGRRRRGLRVSRASSPAAFALLQGLYALAGIGLAGWGALIAAGIAAPLALR